MANSLLPPDQLPVQQRQRHNNHSPNWSRKISSQSQSQSSSPPHCDQSSAAALDIAIFLVVVGACGFLITPYFKYVCHEVSELVPVTFLIIGELIYQAPIAYASGAVFMFVSLVGAWEFYQHKLRMCDNPHCRGLRKAMELDIQLQTEKCVKSGQPVKEEIPWNGGFEIGQDQKELEAELRRMAPPNGKAVLIFRAPCGCPAARFEAWGSKSSRRSKK